MKPTPDAMTEQQRLAQRRFIEIAISGTRHGRPPAARLRKADAPAPTGVSEPQVVLTATKRDKRFESAVSASAVREAIYQMQRYGWTVAVGEEHAAPVKAARR
jgi:hypothetical protein